MVEARRVVRLRIEGRVQGVGFRAFVEREAVGRGLDGWVRNRRDGGVEAVLAGPARGIEAMIARCREGPPGARVDMVKVLDEAGGGAAPEGFDIRPTV
ncbi:MAG: acylphosphatase [Hyphomicrobiaceae bacterium]